MGNAKTQALSHIEMISVLNPRLETLITKEMMPDISNEVKNDETSFWYFRSIMANIQSPIMVVTNFEDDRLICNRKNEYQQIAS